MGHHIQTNSQLFIGERRGDSNPKQFENDNETDSFSNSLSHWIVVIEIPAEDRVEEISQSGENLRGNYKDCGYLMAHAVDESR